LKVRPTLAASNAREHFYTRYETDTSCSSSRFHVTPSVVGSTVQLVPSCNMISWTQPAQSAGVIAAAGEQSGHFEVEASPIMITNRLNIEVYRSRFSWRPDAPVTDDVRVFLLAGVPGQAALPSTSVTYRACASNSCFDVSIDGAVTTLEMSAATGRPLPLSIY
jgi:hypothetical protein